MLRASVKGVRVYLKRITWDQEGRCKSARGCREQVCMDEEGRRMALSLSKDCWDAYRESECDWPIVI